MPKCSATGCKSLNKAGIQFHPMPRDTAMRNAWIKAAKIKDWNPHNNVPTFLCSEHFTKKDFQINEGDANTRILKKSAIPTIFKTTDENKTDTESAKTPSEDTSKYYVLEEIILPAFTNCSFFQQLDSLTDLEDMTGLNLSQFRKLLTSLPNATTTSQNLLLLFLIKLKSGLCDAALSKLFQVGKVQIREGFLWVLTHICRNADDFIQFDLNYSPQIFQLFSAGLKMVVIFLEIPIAKPKRKEDQMETFSKTKSTFTRKYLISFSLSGNVAAISKSYPGKSSDTEAFRDSKLVSGLKRNEVVWVSRDLEHLSKVVSPSQNSEEAVDYIRQLKRKIKDFGIFRELNGLEANLTDIVKACCVVNNCRISNCM